MQEIERVVAFEAKTNLSALLGKVLGGRVCHWLIVSSALVLAALGAGLWYANPPPLAEAARYPGGTIIRDSAGHILRVGLGPGEIDCRPFYRVATNDWIVAALVATEDRRFWCHNGVDLRAVARATAQNIGARRRVSGASTLTMQTVRLLRARRRRTLWLKLGEAVQALRLERALGKEAILEQYLNRAPFGSNLAGIEAAAQGWFGKESRQLNLGEAALLAGMVQAPTRLRPDRHLAAALRRRALVLRRMREQGYITAAQQRAAARVPLDLQRAPRPFAEPFFCDWVQRHLPPGDHRTTLDPVLQSQARGVVRQYRQRYGHDIAVVVLDIPAGNVRVWHCSGDYFDAAAGQVNTVLAPRLAGSTLKPFAYALAMDRGVLTPERKLPDVPQQFGQWRPLNFAGSFSGPVSAREALIRSLNLPAVAVTELVGQPRLLTTLRRLGFTNLDQRADHYGLGLVLGNAPVSLLELAQAYACLACGGVPLPESVAPAAPPLFSAGACWLVSDILGGVERSRAAVGHIATADMPRFAWKTGTSAGFRDAWTIAWNPGWVVAVWCGGKSGRSGGEMLTGADRAAPIAWEIARQLPAAGWFTRPPTVEARQVCAASGMPAGALCGALVGDWGLQGRTLATRCSVHAMDDAGQVCERWPPAVATWLERHDKAPRPGRPAGVLRIVAPTAGAVFRLLEGLVAQEIVFTASGVTPGAAPTWFCDGVALGVGATLRWRPLAGQHQITCADHTGAADTVQITVEE